MKKEYSLYTMVKFYIALIILSAIIWIFLIFGIWTIKNILKIDTDIWTMINSLSTIVAVATFAGGGYIAFTEIAEASKSRYIDVADRLFSELNSERNIIARRWIYRNLVPDPAEGIENLDEQGREFIKLVLNTLDKVSFLTQSGWIPEELIMPWLHPMIRKSWSKLGPYVYFERERRNEPYYYKYAEEIGNRCQVWADNNCEEVSINWIDKAI